MKGGQKGGPQNRKERAVANVLGYSMSERSADPAA